MNPGALKEALQYTHLPDGSVKCSLCSHQCTIHEGKIGICSVRKNKGGTLYATTYGKVSAEAVDPIEKKPLFHYLPGTLSYSLGSLGCNFHCDHCQNWHISQKKPGESLLRDLSPEEGVARARANGCASISWTYNEPTIWHEYTLAMGALARQAGLGTVYVTNGYITPDALAELSPVLSAFRVDIKAFSDDFYRKVCGGRLQPVLDATLCAHDLGMHIETVTLIIPGKNDSPEETESLISWVVENLGPQTPMHFSRFHPDYHTTSLPPTPVATLERVYQQARALGVEYPYLGNVPGHPGEHTMCPACGALLISRSGFTSRFTGLAGDQCAHCGKAVPLLTHA